MTGQSGALTLPGPLQRRIDGMARAFLSMPAGQAVDFSTPEGEPAIVPSTSVSWRVFKNPVTVFIGGVTGVLLELAEPRVRDGIWNHSTFPTDPMTRLKRTGLAAMVTVYGPRSAAEALIARVINIHERVTGRTSDGVPYRANDPELLDWVHATAYFGFMQAYHVYAQPLSPDERDAFLAEGCLSGRLYGAVGAPVSQGELDARLAAMEDKLVASPVVGTFLDIMGQVPLMPTVARPLQRMFLRAAVDLLPGGVRERLALGPDQGLKPWQRAIVRRAGSTADRIVLPESPAAQSCLRLGLPVDYLQQSR